MTTGTVWLLAVVLFVKCVAAEDLSREMRFSCLRPTTPCYIPSGASCDPMSGACGCRNGGFRGLQCQTFSPFVDSDPERRPVCNSMNNPCSENGVCFARLDNEPASCICNSGYYGQYCDYPMLSVDCMETRMRIYVRPWGYAAATWQANSPFIDGTTAELTRVEEFTPSTPEGYNATGLEGYVGEFDYTNDVIAGDAGVFENETVLVYTRNISVRYDPDGPHPTDELLPVSCTFYKSTTNSSTSTTTPM